MAKQNGSRGKDELKKELEQSLAGKAEGKEPADERSPEGPRAGDPLSSPPRLGLIKYREVTVFLRQLVMLVETGTPLMKALKTLSQRVQNPNMRKMVGDICASVEAGNPLWQSFARHTKHFPGIFVNLIKAGEAAGTLPTILHRLVEYRDRREMLQKRLRSAMIYPVIVIVAVIAVLFIVCRVVVPQFQEMFDSVDAELPPVSQFVISVTSLLGTYWWLVLLIVAGLGVLYRFYGGTRNGRITLDRLKMKLPVIGTIVTNATVTDFARTFSMLLGSGISILTTLDLVKDSLSNRAFAERLLSVRDSVERGEGLEAPLRQNDLMPPVVTDMLVTGEESGSLDSVSGKIAEIYQEEVDIAIGTLQSLIEPLLALCLGIIVLIVVLALFVPYIELIQSLTTGGLG
jgi:type IV pilus assembly protein PilC